MYTNLDVFGNKPAKLGHCDPKRTGGDLLLHAHVMKVAGIRRNPTGFTKNPRLRLPPGGRYMKACAKLVSQRSHLRALGESVSSRPPRSAACAMTMLVILEVPSASVGFNSPASPNLEGGAVIGLKGLAPRFPGSIGLHLNACKPFSIKPRRLDRSQGFHASGNAKRVAVIGIGFKPCWSSARR